MLAKQDLVNLIVSYINRSGGSYRDWYAGITSDPKQRLFVEHGVSESSGYWVYDNTYSTQDARDVEVYLLRLGCDGGIGGGDYMSRTVYAYRKAANTRP